MGLKRRSKANAEFNMSSLTDIIFLLLIFFMLTSSLASPNAKNVKRPKSNSTTPSPQNIAVSTIKDENTGVREYFVESDKVPYEMLEGVLADAIEKERKEEVEKGHDPNQVTVVLNVDAGEKTGTIVSMIALSSKLGVRLILATDPPKQS